MSILKIFDKGNVPDELPALAIEDVEKKIKQEKPKEIKPSTIEKDDDKLIPEKKQEQNTPKEAEKQKMPLLDPKDTFFSKIQEDLTKEISDLTKVEDWYSNSLLPEDMLSEMRIYWEKQKSSSIMKMIGINFQEKIYEKIQCLQKLEKEWQEAYFRLMEKEEEIKTNEKELKKALSEFIEIYKKKKDELDNAKEEKPQ